MKMSIVAISVQDYLYEVEVVYSPNWWEKFWGQVERVERYRSENGVIWRKFPEGHKADYDTGRWFREEMEAAVFRKEIPNHIDLYIARIEAKQKEKPLH